MGKSKTDDIDIDVDNDALKEDFLPYYKAHGRKKVFARIIGKSDSTGGRQINGKLSIPKTEWPSIYFSTIEDNYINKEERDKLIDKWGKKFVKREIIRINVELDDESKKAGYSNDVSLEDKYFCYFLETVGKGYNKGVLTISDDYAEFELSSDNENKVYYSGPIICAKSNGSISLFRQDKAAFLNIMIQLYNNKDVLVASCQNIPAGSDNNHPTVHRMILSKYDLGKDEDILKTILPILKIGDDEVYYIEEKEDNYEKVKENIRNVKGDEFVKRLEKSMYEKKIKVVSISESILKNANEGRELLAEEKTKIFSILKEYALNTYNDLNIKKTPHHSVREYIFQKQENQKENNDKLYIEEKEKTRFVIGRTDTLFTGGKELESEQNENSDLNTEELKSKKTVLESYPKRLILEITNNCNGHCRVCGIRAIKEKHSLSYDDFCWFEPLFEKKVIEEVTLFGVGEPTLHEDFPKMLKKLDEYSVRKYFCTNGTMPERYEDYVFDYHVDNLAISIDRIGETDDEKGGHSKSLTDLQEHLTRILKRKDELNIPYPFIRIVYCLMKDNLKELPNFVEKAIKIGVNEVKVVYMTAYKDKDHPEDEKENRKQILWNDKDDIEDIFNQLEEKAKRIKIRVPYIPKKNLIGDNRSDRYCDPAGKNCHGYCEVAWRDFFVGADGWIRPCMSTSEKFFKLDKSKSFFDMWNGSEFQHHRLNVNNFKDPRKMSEQCRTCYQASHANWNKRYAFDQCDIKSNSEE